MTDWELIQSAQQGQRVAFQKLVQRYQKRAYYFAYDLTGNHDDAQDLSQEVFIQMYRSLHRFRGDARFSTWLYRVTWNTWMNQKRRRNAVLARVSDSLDDTTVNLPSSGETPDHVAERSLLYEHIQKATQVLSAKEKTVFMLRQQQDQKLEEIAEIMGIKVGTVKSLLFRALKKMQQELSFYKDAVRTL